MLATRKFLSVITVFSILISQYILPVSLNIASVHAQEPTSQSEDSNDVSVQYDANENTLRVEFEKEVTAEYGFYNQVDIEAFKTENQSNAVFGSIENKTSSRDIPAATCSNQVCVEQDVLYGILKVYIENEDRDVTLWYKISGDAVEIINEFNNESSSITPFDKQSEIQDKSTWRIEILSLTEDDQNWLDNPDFSIEPTSTPPPSPSSTLTPSPSPATEEIASLSPSVVPSITQTESTEESKLEDNTEEEKLQDDESMEKKTVVDQQPIEENVRYEAPTNKFMSVTFTDIPESWWELLPFMDKDELLTIEEIQISPKEAEKLGMIGTTIYRVETTMENGTFKYDLQLPADSVTELDNPTVLYAKTVEDLMDGSYNKIQAEAKEGYVEVKNLDHFTVFVVTDDVTPLTGPACVTAGADSGSDCFNGIQDAINAAVDGDTIQVEAGTYNESLVIDKEITLEGEDGAIIDGAGQPGAGISIRSGNVTVDNFQIRNTSNDGITVGYESNPPGNLQNVVITNNVIHDTNASPHGFGIYVGYEAEGFNNGTLTSHLDYSGLLIEGNEVYNTEGAALVLQSITASSGTLMVRNNTFRDAGQSGTWVSSARNVTFEGNTFENNSFGLFVGSLIADDSLYGPEDIRAISCNSFLNNTNNKILLASTSTDLTATGNWWGAISGPQSNDIDAGSGTVTTDPYALNESCSVLSNQDVIIQWIPPYNNYFTRLGDVDTAGNQVGVNVQFTESPVAVNYYEYQFRASDIDGTNPQTNILQLEDGDELTCDGTTCTWNNAVFNSDRNNIHRIRAVFIDDSTSPWSNWDAVSKVDFASINPTDFEYQDFINGEGVFDETAGIGYSINGGGFAIREEIVPESQIDSVSPGIVNSPDISIDYSSSDVGTEVKTVELWYSFDGGSYGLLDQSSFASGTFNVSLTDGDGDYCFYTIAEDVADDLFRDNATGNQEDAKDCVYELTLDGFPEVSVGFGNDGADGTRENSASLPEPIVNTPSNDGPEHNSTVSGTIPVYATATDSDEIYRYHFRIIEDGDTEAGKVAIADGNGFGNGGYIYNAVVYESLGPNAQIDFDLSQPGVQDLDTTQLVNGNYWLIIGARDNDNNRTAGDRDEDPRIRITVDNPAPTNTQDIEVCKENGSGESQEGWSMYVTSPRIETVEVSSGNAGANTNVITSSQTLNAGTYILQASGTYLYRPGNPNANISDAGYSLRDPNDPVYGGPDVPWVNVNTFPSPVTGSLGVNVNGTTPEWGDFNEEHVYTLVYEHTGGQIDFTILDDNYRDNSGSIDVEIYEVLREQETEASGCTVFEDLQEGDYTLFEEDRDGWERLEGATNDTVPDNGEVSIPDGNADDTPTYTFVNQLIQQPDLGTIDIVKLICEDGSILSPTSFETTNDGTVLTEDDFRPREDGTIAFGDLSLDEITNDTFDGCRLAEENEGHFTIAHQPGDESGAGEPNGDTLPLSGNPYGTDANGRILLDTLEVAGRYEVFDANSDGTPADDRVLGFACFRNDEGAGNTSNTGEYVIIDEARNADNNYGACLAFNLPIDSDLEEVTVCKEDEFGNRLEGWEMTLGLENRDLVSTFVLNANDRNGEDTIALLDGTQYAIEVTGTWQNNSRDVDAEYYSDNGWVDQYDMADQPGRDDRQLDVVIDNNEIDWGSYNASNTYSTIVTGNGSGVNVRVYDEDNEPLLGNWYSDNFGSLTVNIYQIGEDSVTQATLANGCTIFTGIEPGMYTLTEESRNGWQIVTDPTDNGYILIEENEDTVYTFVNERVLLTQTIKVCKENIDESFLDGWEMTIAPEDSVFSQSFISDEQVQSSYTDGGTGGFYADLPAGQYIVRATGTYQYGFTNEEIADANNSFRLPGVPCRYNGTQPVPGSDPNGFWVAGTLFCIDGLLELRVNQENIAWGNAFNEDHIYTAVINHPGGEMIFDIYDDFYGDNRVENQSNPLSVEVFAVEQSEITGSEINASEGCVIFEDVIEGDYILSESLLPGWERSPDADNDTVPLDGVITLPDGDADDIPSYTFVNQLIQQPNLGTIEIVKLICEDGSILSDTSFETTNGGIVLTEDDFRPREDGTIAFGDLSLDEITNDTFDGCRLAEENEGHFTIAHQPGDERGEGEPNGDTFPLSGNPYGTDANGKVTLNTLGVAGRYEVIDANSDGTPADDRVLGFACFRNGEGEGNTRNTGEYVIIDEARNAENNYGACLAFNLPEQQVTTGGITIQKTNNVLTQTLGPSDQVTYTIEVMAEDDTQNVEVYDLPPEDFFYDSGSGTANSNVRGSIPVAPTYASPGVWQLGDMVAGEVVTLTYTTTISSSIETGVYPDLAWAQDSTGTVLAMGTNSPFVNDEFVGTEVEVARASSQEGGVSVDVEEERTEEASSGDVLGASTGLPATGANSIWALISVLLAIMGLSSIVGGRFLMVGKAPKIRMQSIKIVVYIIFTFVAFFYFTTSETLAVDTSIRVSEPERKTRDRSFNLSYVTMDLLDRTVSVSCQKKGPLDGSFTTFETQTTQAGGDSGNCQVDSSVITQDESTYEFRAQAVANSSGVTITSNVVTIEYNTKDPGTPRNYSKSKSGCTYKIKFTAANDDKTDRVEIYRSEEKSFTADGGTRVGDVAASPDKSYEFNDTPGDCGKTYYYAIRAFDEFGNGSGIVGDKEVKVTIIGSSSSSSTSSSTSDSSASTSFVSTVGTTDTESVAETESTDTGGGSDTDQTPDDESSDDETTDEESTEEEEEENEEVLGEELDNDSEISDESATTETENNNVLFILIALGVVGFGIVGYILYSRR